MNCSRGNKSVCGEQQSPLTLVRVRIYRRDRSFDITSASAGVGRRCEGDCWLRELSLERGDDARETGLTFDGLAGDNLWVQPQAF